MYGVQSRLTGGEYRSLGVGLSYSRDLSPWLAAEAQAQYTASIDLNEGGLLDVDGSWHRHLTAAVHGLVLPVRLQAFAAEHRVGVALGLAIRRKEERLLSGTYYPVNFRGHTDLDELIIGEWESIGEGFQAYQIEYDDGAGGREDGTYVALTFPNERTDIGLSGGLAYEMRVGRGLLGGRALYFRYRDQAILTGTHAFALSIRAGYRF